VKQTERGLGREVASRRQADKRACFALPTTRLASNPHAERGVLLTRLAGRGEFSRAQLTVPRKRDGSRAPAAAPAGLNCCRMYHLCRKGAGQSTSEGKSESQKGEKGAGARMRAQPRQPRQPRLAAYSSRGRRTLDTNSIESCTRITTSS